MREILDNNLLKDCSCCVYASKKYASVWGPHGWDTGPLRGTERGHQVLIPGLSGDGHVKGRGEGIETRTPHPNPKKGSWFCDILGGIDKEKGNLGGRFQDGTWGAKKSRGGRPPLPKLRVPARKVSCTRGVELPRSEVQSVRSRAEWPPTGWGHGFGGQLV